MAPDTPAQLNTPGRLALYNNLKGHVAASRDTDPAASYGEVDATLDLALRHDEAVKQRCPADWRGVVAREQIVRQAMYEVLKDIEEVKRLFSTIFAQKEY